MEVNLANRVAVVTGAGRGLGRAIARALAASGGRVVVADMDLAPAERVVAEIAGAGGEAIPVEADVANHTAVESMIQKAVEQWGTVDILINNAGITRDAMLHRMTREQWDQVLKVHVYGAFNCLQAVAPYMRRKDKPPGSPNSKVINVTSAVGFTGNMGQVNYSAAKAAIVGLTRTMAREWAPFGVCVNAIAPVADTDMTRSVSEEARQFMIKAVPLGRMGDAENDIAPMVVFLASPLTDYVTGQVICIDGGALML